MVNIGDLIYGKYILIEKLPHEGTACYLYKAHDRNSNSTVLIKIVDKKLDDIYQSAVQGSKILRNLTSEGFPRVYDIYEDAEYFYIIRQFVIGTTLDRALKERSHSIIEIYDYLNKICERLEYLHRHNALYLDLKLSNIVVDEDGKIWLIDFGSAARKGQITKRTGTPNNTPPELYSDTERVDTYTDIHEFGTLMKDIKKITVQTGKELDSKSKLFHQYNIIASHCCKDAPEERYKAIKDIKKGLFDARKQDIVVVGDNSNCIEVPKDAVCFGRADIVFIILILIAVAVFVILKENNAISPAYIKDKMLNPGLYPSYFIVLLMIIGRTMVRIPSSQFNIKEFKQAALNIPADMNVTVTSYIVCKNHLDSSSNTRLTILAGLSLVGCLATCWIIKGIEKRIRINGCFRIRSIRTALYALVMIMAMSMLILLWL